MRFKNNAMIEHEFCNTTKSGCISRAFILDKDDELTAGAYSSNFPINIYCAKSHDSFTVALMTQLE